jgi:hypothetical protein
MEYLRPGMRTLGLNMCIGLFYCVGSIAVPWVALVAREWRHFLLYLSAPMLLVPCYYWLLPESARWLIHRGRVQEAVVCFQRISAFNGKGELPSAAVEAFKVTFPRLCKLKMGKRGTTSIDSTSHGTSYLKYYHVRVTIDGVWTDSSIY